MMRSAVLWSSLLLIPPILGACSKESEPPPPVNTVLSNGSQDLPPVPLARPDSEGLPPVSSARYLKKIAGPAGNPAELSLDKPGAKPAEAAKAIALNDTEAEPLVKQFVELSNAGDFEATAGMFVAEQQPTIRKFAAATTALVKNLTRLRTSLQDAAPDVAKQFQPDEKGAITLKAEDGTEIPIMVGASNFELVGVTPQGEDKATATVRGGGVEKKVEMEKVDGKWRLREANLPPSPEAAGAMLAVISASAKAFGEVADKVEKTEVQPTDAMKEVVAAMKRAMEAAKTAKPEGAEATSQEPPPAADNAPEPAEPTGNASPPPPKPKRKPGESASGRDVNNDMPTIEETLGRQ